jgi:ABC-type uncharacterized transport system permease subunit
VLHSIANLAAAAISGVLSDYAGLPLALTVLLVTGMISGILLLLLARSYYDEDHERQRDIGEFTVDLES